MEAKGALKGSNKGGGGETKGNVKAKGGKGGRGKPRMVVETGRFEDESEQPTEACQEQASRNLAAARNTRL